MELSNKVVDMRMQPASKESYIVHQAKVNDVYQITKRKGRVLILNNEFKGEEDERKACKDDVKNMHALWTELGCSDENVVIQNNKPANEMKEELQKFANCEVKTDFVAVIIMTHGYKQGNESNFEDQLLGNDKDPIKVRDILEMFSNENAKLLQEIPKLFFLQFCRGGKFEGVEKHEQDFTDSLPEVERDSVPDLLPNVSDMFIAYASQKGYAALKYDEEKTYDKFAGSWFINAIVNVFREHAKDEDICGLMTKVNRAVKEEIAYKGKSDEYTKQMSEFISHLTKKLYFFPGQPVED